MKKVVHKYVFTRAGSDVSRFQMPVGAKVLFVHEQNGNPCMWALVDPEAPTEIRAFRMVGTGHLVDDITDESYCGTALLLQGSFVIHIFEVPISLKDGI